MDLLLQNISTVKLEKMRQKIVKVHKRLFRLPVIVFALLMVWTVVINWISLSALFSGNWTGGARMGAILYLIGQVMMNLTVSCVVFLFYYILVWHRQYQHFNFTFKNKYVLQTLLELPGFADLRYESAKAQFSFDEIQALHLIPPGEKGFFQSTDQLSGTLDQVRFCAGNVVTEERSVFQGRRTLPDTRFSGQVIAFSQFDNRKISDGCLQILPKQALKYMKKQTAPYPVETESVAFHQKFAVFAEDPHNAFYILTPQVMEQILAFAEFAQEPVYLVFCGSSLHVAIQQFRNPFGALVDIPVEEQRKRIVQDSELMRRARDILIQIPRESNSAE